MKNLIVLSLAMLMSASICTCAYADEAPCSFVNSGVPFNGGVITWEDGNWTYTSHSILADLALGGTYDEEGVLTLVDDNIGFGSLFLPDIQAVFTDALNGVFQEVVEAEIYPDNELSESIMAVEDGDFNKLYQFAVAENARIYDPATNGGDTIFYGASNFWYWRSMEEDLAPYAVENHAFGGSADKDLYFWAPYMLYNYNPCIVFFQTGSNDYVQSEAETDELKVAEAMDFKKKMFAEFHEQLPDAKFVVMSGILLPGRAEYVDMTLDINDQLKAFCEETDYMYFVDSEAISYDREKGEFVEGVDDLFIEDGIHLTGESRKVWAEKWIIPMLEELNAPKAGEEELVEEATEAGEEAEEEAPAFDYAAFIQQQLDAVTGEYAFTETEVECQRGDLTLRGILAVPETDDPAPVVILVHGFMANRDSLSVQAKWLAVNGIASVRFDLAGTGTSDGEFKDMSTLTEVEDVNAILDYVLTLDGVDTGHVFLAGFSMGGLVSGITAAQREDDITALILNYPALCLPDDNRAGHIQDVQFDLDDIPATITVGNILGTYEVGSVFITDTLDMDPYELCCGFSKDVLLFHGDADDIVPISYSEKAAQMYPSVEYHVVEGGGHGFYGEMLDPVMVTTIEFVKAECEK